MEQGRRYEESYEAGYEAGYVAAHRLEYGAARGRRGSGRYRSIQGQKESEEYEAERRNFAVRLMPKRGWRTAYPNAVGQAGAGFVLMLCEMLPEGEDAPFGALHRPRAVQWGIDTETLIAEALENMHAFYPPRLFSKEHLRGTDLQREGLFEQDETFALGYEDTEAARRHGLLLTNTLWRGGAVAAFYPGVLERLSEICGGNFYLVFPGENDVRIHPEPLATQRDLRIALAERNKGKLEGEWVMSKIFYYRRETGEIEVVPPTGWRRY